MVVCDLLKELLVEAKLVGQNIWIIHSLNGVNEAWLK